MNGNGDYTQEPSEAIYPGDRVVDYVGWPFTTTATGTAHPTPSTDAGMRGSIPNPERAATMGLFLLAVGDVSDTR